VRRRRVHVHCDFEQGVYYVWIPGASWWSLGALRVAADEVALAALLDRAARLPWVRVAPR
jgi:hypothetical protein